MDKKQVFNENLVCAMEIMQASDIDQVYAIEEQVFPTPWSKQSFAAELLHVYSKCIKVSTLNQIIAYAVIWFIEDEAHIANIAVTENFRKYGIASWIIDAVLELSIKNNIRVIHLEVRKSNDSAINLYKKFGFEITGVRKNYYEAEKEDALMMSKIFN